jgi:hypothetical protein
LHIENPEEAKKREEIERLLKKAELKEKFDKYFDQYFA